MGFSVQDHELPAADSPSLVLANPTPEERERTWSNTHPVWGAALSDEEYLKREAYLMTAPLARDGGITHWILTSKDLPPGERPIYSSCESLRKLALACAPGGQVEEGLTHGIGSVFTEDKYRGKGYAGRMMQEVGKALRTWQAGSDVENGETSNGATSGASNGHQGSVGKRCLFSILYSDIGKKFYASRGWAPFTSTHLSFKCPGPFTGTPEQISSLNSSPDQTKARPLKNSELAELCALDENLLRSSLAHRARRDGARTHVAVVPSAEQMLWHHQREDFVTTQLFGRTPTVRGAVYGPAGRRLWAVWTRTYYGGRERVGSNTLYVLRFGVEREEAIDDDDDGGEVGSREYEYMAEGMRAILRVAQEEARAWSVGSVQMWNPTPALRRVVDLTGVEYELVERDKDSIASLKWYGEGRTEDLDWVLNEKYAWC